MRKAFLIVMVSLLFTGCAIRQNIHTTIDTSGFTSDQNPPELILIIGENEYKTLMGGFEWSYINPDGTLTTVTTDAPGIVDLVEKEKGSDISVGPSEEIELVFAREPDGFVVAIYYTEVDTVLQTLKDNKIITRDEPGEYIYGVKAHWSQGQAEYAFKIIVE